MSKFIHRTLRVATYALAGLALMTLCSAGLAQEKRAEVIVLLHPSVKDWSQTIAAELERKRGPYEIRPIHALNKKGKPVAPKIRYEVGASIKTLKDWTYVLQVQKPLRYGKSLRVPYVFLYRKSKAARPVAFLKRTLTANAPEFFAKNFDNDVPRNMWGMLAAKISAKRGFPVKMVNGKNGKEASVTFHNKWPFGVRVEVTVLAGAGGRLDLMSGRTPEGHVVNNSPVVVLAPGQKFTLNMRMQGDDWKGVTPSSAEVRASIVDATLAPAK
jgi:hypothetical protein